MANEITITATLEYLRTYSKAVADLVKAKKFSQTTQGHQGGEWTVGTAEEDLTLSDVAAPGFAIFVNTDPTNYVELGYSDGGTMKALVRLRTGEPALFRVNGALTIRAKANTAACKVAYLVLND